MHRIMLVAKPEAEQSIVLENSSLVLYHYPRLFSVSCNS